MTLRRGRPRRATGHRARSRARRREHRRGRAGSARASASPAGHSSAQYGRNSSSANASSSRSASGSGGPEERRARARRRVRRPRRARAVRHGAPADEAHAATAAKAPDFDGYGQPRHAGRDGVNGRVDPHGWVGCATAGADQSSASSPTVTPGELEAPEREQHARDVRLARERVVADRQELPGPPRSTSWCATRPGSRTEWIGTSPSIAAAVAVRRAGGRVELRRVVELDDLRALEVPRGLGGEAHHQHGADREVRRVEDRRRPAARAAASTSARRPSPVVPTTHGTPAATAAATFATTASGA